jgi:hypothetical protein
VPEAPVDENYCPVLRENQIRSPRQSLVMKSIPESEAVEVSAHYQLWLRVPTPYPRHELGALCPRELVSHLLVATC